MKVKIVVEVSAEEMAEIRENYGDCCTDEQNIAEVIYENIGDYLQDIEVKII